MSIVATVLFGHPRQEIASLIETKLTTAARIQIVVGFATVEGVSILERPLSTNPAALETFVVGAGTYRAYDALDRILGLGVNPDRLLVHLGHSRNTGSSAKHRFYRYHPMLHSKIYYLEYIDGRASAIIGSHNLTGFAMLGLNGEASVLLEGESTSSEFQKIQNHINSARAESLVYSSDMREAYSWWTHQFVEGLADKVNDAPREGSSKKTIVIICESLDGLPRKGDRVYFELRSALGKIKSLQAEVHLYVFDALPSSPELALCSLHEARASYWCKTIGLEMERGGVELRAEWQIKDDFHPVLMRTPRTFRPTPTRDMQQVRVEVVNEVRGHFKYLFDPPVLGWLPKLDEQVPLSAPGDYVSQLERLELVPQEHLPWYPVRGLIPAEREQNAMSLALEQMSPASGAYILMSLRRIERTE